jgi:hypothetical protein
MFSIELPLRVTRHARFAASDSMSVDPGALVDPSHCAMVPSRGREGSTVPWMQCDSEKKIVPTFPPHEVRRHCSSDED